MKKILPYTLYFILYTAGGFSQGKDPSFYTHISFTPVYSYYVNNKHHTTNTKPAFSFAFTAREEWRFTRGGALVAGVEYFSHGFSFDSYFFAPNRSFLYDKNFSYHYKVRMKEVDFPLLIRGNFINHTRKSVEGYFEIGASLRYLYSSSMFVIDSTGIPLWDNPTKIEFETPLFARNMSMWMQFNWGLQFYHPDHKAGFFMEMNFRYAPIRFYINESFTPADLYIQSFHIGIGAGFRF
ncbi:MAG: hypothetical protein IAF38_07320 [Bacteroidia bacterium]|nr:hypothetical protein [Bacteroidia bacterium]